MKSLFTPQVGQTVPIVDCRNKNEVSFNLLTKYLCVPLLSVRGLSKSSSSSSFNDLLGLEGQLDLSQTSCDTYSFPLISDSSRTREITLHNNNNFTQVWQDCSFLSSQTCFGLQKENSNFKDICSLQQGHSGDSLSDNIYTSIPALIKLYFAATVTSDKKEEKKVESSSVGSCRIVESTTSSSSSSEYKHPFDNTEKVVHQFSFMVDYIGCDSDTFTLTSNSRKMSVENLQYPNMSKESPDFSFDCSKSMLYSMHHTNEVFSKSQVRVCENFKAAKCISPQTNLAPETPVQSQSSAKMSSESLQYVLFDRKKCTKKGRPSSKKQKKRQREKRKNSDKIHVDGVSTDSVGTNYTTNIPGCLDCKMSNVSSVISNCFCSHLLPSSTSTAADEQSSPHSSPSKSPEHVSKLTTSLFILERNSSTDTDCEDSDVSWDDGWSDNCSGVTSSFPANDDLLDLFTPCLYEVSQKGASCSESSVNSFVASFSFQPDSLSDSEDNEDDWSDWSDADEASDDDSLCYSSDSFDADFCLSGDVTRKSLKEINKNWDSWYCRDSEGQDVDEDNLKVKS